MMAEARLSENVLNPCFLRKYILNSFMLQCPIEVTSDKTKNIHTSIYHIPFTALGVVSWTVVPSLGFKLLILDVVLYYY